MREFVNSSRRLVATAIGLTIALGAITPGAVAQGASAAVGSTHAAVVVAATNIDITLPTGRRIAGKVVRSDNSGVANVLLTACVATGGECLYATSKADGTFSIGGLPPNTYLLSATHPTDSPLLGGYFGPSGFAATPAAATKINVTKLDAISITIKLPTSPREITGKVLGIGAEATGLPGMQVSACPSENQGCITGTSLPDGSFTIPGVPAGSYRLRVQAPLGSQYVSPMWFGKSGKPSTNPTAVASLFTVGTTDVTAVKLQMSRARAIRGVLTGADGTPIVDAITFACGGTTCVSGLTRADGSFALFGALPGTYNLRWLRPSNGTFASGILGPTGFEPGWGSYKTFPVAATADVTLPRIAVPKSPYSISGTVRDAGRKPLGNAMVTACTSVLSVFPLLSCEAQTTGADGRFAIALLVPGSYTVRVAGRPDINARGGFWATSGWAATDALAGRVVLGVATFPAVKTTVPKTDAAGVKTTSLLKVTFTADVRNANATTVTLLDAGTNNAVAATVTYDAATRTATLKPKAKLKASTPYVFQVSLSVGSVGSIQAVDWRPILPVRVTFVTA